MSVTLSNKYYLQAVDNYPYELSEVIESLNYAISYNSDHAGAHCLLGRLYMEELKQYEKAEHHFEQALVADLNYSVTYEHYSLLLITTGEFERALKLIEYALKIKGINISLILHRKGLVYENLGKLKKAKKIIKKAYQQAYTEEIREFLQTEHSRLKDKLKKKK